MRRAFLKQVGVVALTLALGTSALSANPNTWPKEINFGVIPVSGATSLKDTFGGLMEYLEKTLGVKINMQSASDYTGVITAMQHGHVQVAYLGPKSYVEAAKRAKAEAIVIEVDAETGLSGYYGMIITKAGSGLKSLEDIKGKRWAFTSPQSTSGTLVPTVMFLKKGIDPKKYFSKVHYSGGHEASILSIMAERIDAVSTNNLDFNRGLGRNWERDDFNVIWKSDLIPGAPVAVRSDLPESLKMALKGALISYSDEAGMNKMKNRGFVAGDDSVFDPIRDLIKVKESLKK